MHKASRQSEQTMIQFILKDGKASASSVLSATYGRRSIGFLPKKAKHTSQFSGWKGQDASA